MRHRMILIEINGFKINNPTNVYGCDTFTFPAKPHP